MTLEEWIANPTLKVGSLNAIMWHLVDHNITDPSPQALGRALRAAGWTRVHLRKGSKWMAPGTDRAAAGMGTSHGVRMLLRRAMLECFATAQLGGRLLLTDLRRQITETTGIKFQEGSPSMRLLNDALQLIGHGQLEHWHGQTERCGEDGKDRRKVYLYTATDQEPDDGINK